MVWLILGWMVLALVVDGGLVFPVFSSPPPPFFFLFAMGPLSPLEDDISFLAFICLVCCIVGILAGVVLDGG